MTVSVVSTAKETTLGRVCENCGSPQGPFSRLRIGDRKNGRWVFTCPVPLKDEEGKPMPDSKRKEIAAACTNRREKRNGAAQKAQPQGG